MTLSSARLPKFAHGGDIYSATSPVGRWLDFSANINPMGMPAAAKKAIIENIDSLVHYPDPEGRELKQAISGFCGMAPECIVLGNGAAELFYVYFHALRPKRVLLPVPSFNEYERAAGCAGAEIDYFFLQKENGFQPDLASLIEALPGHDVLIMGNPNNPTGNLLTKQEIALLAEAGRAAGCRLVIDESFLDFRQDKGLYTAVGLLDRFDNIMIVTSLTKFFAIPGLRLGFGLADSKLARRLEGNKDVWNVNLLAQKAGAAVLRDAGYQRQAREMLAGNMREFYHALRLVSGIRAYAPSVNFVLLELLKQGMNSAGLCAFMKRYGILVRDCSNYPGLDDKFVRLAVRSKEENAVVLQRLKEYAEAIV